MPMRACAPSGTAACSSTSGPVATSSAPPQVELKSAMRFANALFVRLSDHRPIERWRDVLDFVDHDQHSPFDRGSVVQFGFSHLSSLVNLHHLYEVA